VDITWNSYTNKILAEIDNEAFFLNELKNIRRRGIEAKAECPFKHLHDSQTDHNPSLTVNLAKGIYYCNTCHSKGNVHTMYKAIYNCSSEEAWFQLGDALRIPRPDGTKPFRPEIDSGLARFYHNELMKLTGPIRQILREKRGLTDETLQRFQLGWDGERLTIPIYNEFNELVNFRRYKWNSNEDQIKVLNYVDELQNSYGEVRIFNIDRVVDNEVDYIVWTEGELDAIIAEQYGFYAACATAGAGTWKPEWSRLFRGKNKVIIMQDNDDAGRIATSKLCNRLYHIIDVYTVNWPPDFPAKGDITDFFVKLQMGPEDFQHLIDTATKYADITVDRIADESAAIEVHLSHSANAEYYGQRIKVPVMVSGKDSTPYLCPKTFVVKCGELAGENNKKCINCSLAKYAGEITRTLCSSDEDLQKLIKCTEKQRDAVIFDILQVNPKCKDVKITIVDYMNIEELRLIPKAEANFGFSKEQEYVVRAGYYIGKDIQTNKKYTLVGYLWANPTNQIASLVFDKSYPEKDVISEFELNEETIEHLKLFQKSEDKTVHEMFETIHQDLERNITYVWERRNVAFGIDLVYHTALSFYLQDQHIKRGWGELLIIGDSGQAKTTIVEKLMTHYRLGDLHSGESSRRTGLVYSLQQANKRWFLVWGAFPLNDGGLIAIDELSGLSENELAEMSDVRSSGIAKSTGVVTAETSSRTRAIYISNPRNGRQINSEPYGVLAVAKLMGKSEDVRRLDLAISVASGDIDPALVNRTIEEVPTVPHIFTSDACNTRVLWAWSRRPENIIFTKEATATILKYATEMGKKYSSKVPIVEAADQRLKIARLSIAAAACVVSTNETFEEVIVLPEHVEFVVNFMQQQYDAKSFGYDKLSIQEALASDESEDKLQVLRAKYAKLPLMDLNTTAKILLELSYFNTNTLNDYLGLETTDLKVLMKFLTNNYLIEKATHNYRKLPLGKTFFEDLVNKPLTKEEIKTTRVNTEY